MEATTYSNNVNEGRKLSKMVKSLLEGLENPQRPLLGPNYKFLQWIGLIFPKSRTGKAAYILLHEVATCFVCSQYLELYFIRTDMQEVITNLKISMLSTVIAVKANTAILWQDKWNKVLDYITDADKFERDHADEVREKIIHKYTRYCRIVTYFYWSLTFTTVFSVISTPLLRYLSSSTYQEELRNGTEPFPQIFSSWVPFDKNHFPGYWVTVLWHAFTCSYGGAIMAAYDANAIVVMVFFGGKLELLRERCKQMMGSLGNGISDEDADKGIRQIHNIHTLLTENFRLFNSILSPVMFLYVVNCSLMMCTSAYQLTSATNAMQKLWMAQYLIFAVAQLFMFCWHSSDVIMKSDMVYMGPYESEWWSTSVRQRRSVLILLGQLRISYLFTAGPFTDLTLATFITIMKGSYSYYTLLK